MLKDRQGLFVTTQRPDAILAIDNFKETLIRHKKGIEVILDVAEKYDDCCLIQCYAACIYLFSQDDDFTPLANPYIEQAEKTVLDANEREKLYYAAITAWQALNYEKAIDFFLLIATQWPEDIVSAKLAEFLFYACGQCYHGRRYLNLCRYIYSYHKDNPYFLAMYAFAEELTGNTDRALLLANQAITIDSESAWAHHTLAHVYMMKSDFGAGMDFLESVKSSWESIAPPLAKHNLWHLCLCHLAMLDYDSVKSFYAGIWQGGFTTVIELADAIGLLMRLELAGQAQSQKDWQKIFTETQRHLSELYIPYLNAHYLYAAVRAGREDIAHEALANLTKNCDAKQQRAVWQPIGLSLLSAIIDYAKGNYKKALVTLKPLIIDVQQVGGSDAQIELFYQIYLKSLIGAKRTYAANMVLNQYLPYYKGTPLWDHWLDAL